MEAVVQRLEAVARKLESLAGGAVEVNEDLPPEGYVAVKAIYDNEFNDFLASWANCGAGDYNVKKAEYAPSQMRKAFDNILAYLKLQNKCKKPSQAEMQEFLIPILEAQVAMEKLTRTRSQKLRKYDNHHIIALRVVEGLMWVVHYPPSLPASHYNGCADSCETTMLKFWQKGTDGDKEMRKVGLSFLKAFPDVIKEHYKTGVEFRGKANIGEADAPEDAPAPAASTKKADPAKSEEAVEPAKKTTKKKKKNDGAALLGDLTKGLAVTAGLKKVNKNQKNKYKKEKVKGTVAGGPTMAKVKKKKEPKVRKAGPYTWQFLDYQNKGLVTLEDEKYDVKTQLYLADCINTNFKVPGKVKSITLDGCKRVQIQIDESLVSSIEVVNCKNVTIWALNTVPTITLDKCDSPKLFLGEKAWRDAETKPTLIYSAVTAGNVVFSDGENQADVPIPEQFQITGVGEDGKATISLMDHGD